MKKEQLLIGLTVLILSHTNIYADNIQKSISEQRKVEMIESAQVDLKKEKTELKKTDILQFNGIIESIDLQKNELKIKDNEKSVSIKIDENTIIQGNTNQLEPMQLTPGSKVLVDYKSGMLDLGSKIALQIIII